MRLTLVATLLIGLSSPALAQGVHQYGGLALSPRGDRIATIESAGGDHAAVTLRSAADGRVVGTFDPCKTCGYSGLSFAPNGDLVFLARDREKGTVALDYSNGRTTRTLATVQGIAQTPRVSPDGRSVALLVTLNAAKETGATQAGVRQIGEIGEKSDEQRLAIFPVTGAPVLPGAVKPVSPEGRYIYEYDWTPDSRGFVVTSALGNGDANWWVATLDAIDAVSGTVRQIAKPSTQLNFPRVSPDGKSVAYIGGLMSDFGSVGGDIYTVPITGGTPSDRMPGYKATVTSFDWTSGGIRATTLSGAEAGIIRFDPKKGGDTVWSRPASFGAGDGRVSFSADGSMAATVVQDFEHAPAIYAGPVGAMRQITRDNDAIPSLAAARSITWRNDNYTVQGWLLAPRTADPAAKAPMITIVHGGPAAANTPYFFGDAGPADLIKAGYYVFLPNPRGSYGQGEAFTMANRRDFGGGDLRDILAGIDAVEKQAPIDDARLGLTGGSYGGFMAMWANTQTNRFKGIVAGAGLSNWVSYYGTNGIDQWMLPFFGKTLYEDYKAYEDVSAVYHAKSAKTPTFIYVGERDIEVPPTQSVEWWHALKEQGVPTSLVIYPDEGHGIRDPEHVKDLRTRTMVWFDKYVKGAQ